MLRALLVTALVGCSLASPDDSAYTQAVRPLMLENGRIAHALLSAASASHSGRASHVDIHRQWQEIIVPATEHLAWQAEATPVPRGWRDRHARLVEIWNQRASSYRRLEDAIALADRALWAQASSGVSRAQVDEERWFTDTNLVLSESGLALDPIP